VGAVLALIVAFAAGIGVSSYVNQTRPTVSTTSTISTFPVVSTSVTTSVVYSSATSSTEPTPQWLTARNQVVSWTQTSNYVGQYLTVEGTVVYTFVDSRGDNFLDFHNPYQGYFAVVIFSSDTGSFRCSPASFYLNKDVRVTGIISMYNGSPQIIVNSPSQIEVAYIGFSGC
jgi:DNA/RNA endonuclease YhcR with UshA esterase domain